MRYSALVYSAAIASLVVCALCADDDKEKKKDDSWVVEARDMVGTYSAMFRTSCVKKVHQEGLVSGGNAVAHEMTKADNFTCKAKGEMMLIPKAQKTRINTVVNRLKGSAKVMARKIVSRIPDGSYVGTSDAKRVCGDIVFPKHTLFFFMKPEQPFDTGISGMPELPGRRRLMIIIEPEKDVLCPYTAKLRASPSPSPVLTAVPPGGTVSPSPTPSASQSLSPVQLDNPTSVTGEQPSPSPEEPAGGSVCFPGTGIVSLRGGETKLMRDVQVGDEVAVGGSKYSQVFMFTHRLGKASYSFVSLRTESGKSITLTPGHYLEVNSSLVAAGTVRVGDFLKLADGASSAVTTTSTVKGIGLFNPQTVDGAIVVDGVVASTYTTAVELKAAHALLAPLRSFYLRLRGSIRWLEGGSDFGAALLPSGKAKL